MAVEADSTEHPAESLLDGKCVHLYSADALGDTSFANLLEDPALDDFDLVSSTATTVVLALQAGRYVATYVMTGDPAVAGTNIAATGTGVANSNLFSVLTTSFLKVTGADEMAFSYCRSRCQCYIDCDGCYSCIISMGSLGGEDSLSKLK